MYIPRIGPHISLLQDRKTDPGKNINLSQIYECWIGTGRLNIIILFEITVSFLGIRKWEPDIFIGFSLALHLQCSTRKLVDFI
jgi:hypothetical protein